MGYFPEMVSVVIPTYNGRADLERLLPMLFAQRVEFPFEVICIDSSSTDGTWEILNEYEVKRYRIPQGEFNHGGTRNLGISKSRGEVVILMTQDAIPADENWMAAMVRNYAASDVAGVYCRQLPRADGSLLPKLESVVRITGMDQRRESRLKDHSDYHNKSPSEKWNLCNFDDICSSVRRTVWELFPFRSVNFAEDLDWSKRVFEAGYTIIFEPEAKVIHSHDRTFAYEFKRSFVTWDAVESLFGREGDGYGFIRALGSIAHAPLSLRKAYSQMSDTTFSERIRAYYLIAARALGRAFYNYWYRNLRISERGENLRTRFYRGV